MLKFSANQIAKALRLSYEAVRKRLVDAPCTFQLIAGNQTRVYEVRDLPEDYRSELEKLRNRFGYRDIESLLKDGRPAEIKPEYSQLRESELNQAHRLRRAMQRPLELEGKASSFEVAEAGLEDYKREFDDPISERSWQRKFAEILKRDNGRREWTRLELYVSERALIGLGKYGAKREALAVQAECKVDAENLQAAYRAVGTASEPTSPERAVIWHCAFQEYEAGCSQGQTERQARAPILAIMVGHEIRLCATPEAYKKFWQRSYPRWIEGGRKSLALNDSRHENKGRSPIIVPTQEEVAKVKLLALKTDPNLSDRSVKSLPWRMYAESGECRPELAEVINAPRSSKHTLTPTLRRAGRITSEEKMMVRGPRTYKNSAYKQLRSNTFIDESGTERELLPGMLFESDDMHLNEPFYIPWENATDTLGRKASEFEKATKLWLDVRNGKIHPAQAGFLSFEEVKQNLRKAMSFMNRDCMEGQIKGAPDDLWAAHFSNHPALATPTEAQAVLLQPERREAKIRDGMVHVRSKENEAGFQFHSPKFAALGKSYAVKVCFDATLYTEGAYILNDEAGDRTALKPDRTPYKKDEFICWAECVQRAPQISFSDSETDDYRRRAQFAKAVKSNQCIRFFEPLELYGRKSASMAVEINHGKGEVERIIHSEGKVERHLIADESREDREALKKLRTMEPAGPKASLFARRSSKNSLKNPRETLEAKLAVEAYLKENAE